MVVKSSIKQVFDYLSNDPKILSLLGIHPSDKSNKAIIGNRILMTKQPGILADKNKRLTIWEDKTREQNKRVFKHFLNVDVLVPLNEQNTSGIALVIVDAIGQLLHKKPVGRGLHYLGPLPDQPIGYGWYKATARFTYNAVNK